jgi:thiamine-monophosphate kinase
VIAALSRDLPKGEATLLGPGDDSAVLALSDSRATISTDILVEGVHFRSAWSTGYDLGWRLAAQNLADAAAMGAVPKALVVALAGPPEQLSGEWGLDFARGLAAYCGRWQVGVVGGDLAGAPMVVASGTVVGDLEGRPPVTRSGARVGDVLALSDAVAAPSSPADACALGGSAAGLAWLEAGRPRIAGLEALAEAARAAYLRPDPPLDLGKRAALGGVTAMMDVSDGLATDAGRMARASGVRLIIDPASPALAGAMARWAPLGQSLRHCSTPSSEVPEYSRRAPPPRLDARLTGGNAPPVVGARSPRAGGDERRWVLTGGEDHALVGAFPAESGLPDGWHGIGRVVEPGPSGPGVQILGWETDAPGWDHFCRS